MWTMAEGGNVYFAVLFDFGCTCHSARCIDIIRQFFIFLFFALPPFNIGEQNP
jgi:hypothetical protein